VRGIMVKVGIWAASVLVLLMVVFGIFCPIDVLQGHERAIKENFFKGVVMEQGADGLKAVEFLPRKRWYIRAIDEYVHYDMRKHRYILDDDANLPPEDKEEANGPALMIQVDRGQTVKVRVKVIWRYEAGKLGVVHAQCRNDRVVAEMKVLDTPVRRIAQSLVTSKDALSVYYGDGLKALQTEFKDLLQKDAAITSMGLVIDDAVLFTDLDPKYVEQINAKIVAEQKILAQQQVEKANLAEAEAEKAKAEIEKNKRIVAAEAAKQEQILGAEAANEKTILAAKADMEKQRLEGEGLKVRKIAEAEGVKALKLAEAAGEDALKLAKYDGVAGQRQTEVLIAERVAEKVAGMLKGVQVIPERAFVSVSQQPGMGSAVVPVADVGAAQPPAAPAGK